MTGNGTCLRVTATADNSKANKVLYNADVFGRVYDVTGQPALVVWCVGFSSLLILLPQCFNNAHITTNREREDCVCGADTTGQV